MEATTVGGRTTGHVPRVDEWEFPIRAVEDASPATYSARSGRLTTQLRSCIADLPPIQTRQAHAFPQQRGRSYANPRAMRQSVQPRGRKSRHRVSDEFDTQRHQIEWSSVLAYVAFWAYITISVALIVWSVFSVIASLLALNVSDPLTELIP